MIKKIIFSLLILSVGLVILFQNDHRIHEAVHSRVKKIFEEVGNCSTEFTVERVSLFSLSITLEDVHVMPRTQTHVLSAVDQMWSYHVDKLRLSCSWWSLLLYGIIDLRVDLTRVDSDSTVMHGQVAILEQHIMPMVNAPISDMAVYLKAITFERSTLRLDIPSAPVAITCDWSSQSKKINDTFKTNIHLYDGSIMLNGQTVLAKITGSTSLDLRVTGQLLHLDMDTDCVAQLEQLAENKDCFISGSWHNDTGTFALKSADQKIIFPTIDLKQDDQGIQIKTQGTLPAQSLLNYIDPSLKNIGLEGASELNVTALVSSEDLAIQGKCITKNVLYKKIKIADSSSIVFDKKHEIVEGTVQIQHALLGTIGGSWRYGIGNRTGDCHITNYGSIALPGIPLWSIAQHGGTLDVTLDELGMIKGVYRAAAQSFILGQSVKGQGEFSFNGDQFWSAGRVNQATYQVAFDVAPQVRLQELVYVDSQGNKLIDIHAKDQKSPIFQGPIQFELLRLIIKEFLGYTVQGQGAFSVNGELVNDVLRLKTTLLDGGVIRLPQTYNVVNQFKADVSLDTAKKKIEINELVCALYRGNISSYGGLLLFDDSYGMAQALVPVAFDECLLNFKKDLFAVFSGSLTFTKEGQELPKLFGDLSIDQSQLKENIFSDKFQKELFSFTGNMFQVKSSFDMACNVGITTKKPIRMNTAFFHGQAHARMHVGGTISGPKLSGSIDLLSGSLEFPYKPLMISKGHIYFLPDQMYNPSIELIASNKIKKYDITLHVTGSLLNHDIALTSNPPLTDEQVIALLLVGSQDQSLNAVMPALIMQNLKTVLFDSEQSPLRLSSVFNSWLDPLRKINLVPRFSDQSGRGGLRGALEVEISDRWRAVAEQNFSLTEDTSLEVEYAVSDDITLRGIRNERCDVGAEVEMRWKFGL